MAQLQLKKYKWVGWVLALPALLFFASIGAIWLRSPPVKTFQSPDFVKTRYIDVPNVGRIAYWKVPSSAPVQSSFPMIYLEGGPGIGISNPVAQRFSRRYPDFDIYFVDQIGVGASDRLPRSRITLDNNIAAINQISEQIIGGKAVVVGGSWGAAIAARFAIDHPDRVKALFLSAPAGLPQVCNLTTVLHGQTCVASAMPVINASIDPYPISRLAIKGGSPAKVINRPSPTYIPNGFYFPSLNRLLLADIIAARFPALSALIVPFNQRSKWELEGANTEVNVMLSRQHHAAEMTATLASSAIPTLIIRGNFDRIDPSEVGGYQILFPKTRFVELKNETHHIEYDGCAAIVEARTFLTQHGGAARLKSCSNQLLPVLEIVGGYTLSTSMKF